MGQETLSELRAVLPSEPQLNRLVGVVQLEAGNSASVERALGALGVKSVQVRDEETLKRCSHIILPGVASFGAVIEELLCKSMFAPLKNLYESDVKFMGLCAGMQIMGKGSEENPGVPGLGWFSYENIAIVNNEGSKVFHTGWNSVQMKDSSRILSASDNSSYYFNHSYFVPKVEETDSDFGTTDYFDSTIVSLFKYSNVVGIQFHPEKSQVEGLDILRHFVEWE